MDVHKGSTIRLKRDMYGLLKLHEMCMWPDCSSRRMGDEMYVCRFHATLIESALDDLRIAEDDEYAARLQRWRDSLDRNNEAMNAGEFGDAELPSDGFIYVVQQDNLIKIGFTTNLDRRLRTYPPNAVVLATGPGTKYMERTIHQRYGEHLERGREWFADCDDIRSFVADMVERYGEPDPKYQSRYRSPRDKRGKQVTIPRKYTGVKRTSAA